MLLKMKKEKRQNEEKEVDDFLNVGGCGEKKVSEEEQKESI